MFIKNIILFKDMENSTDNNFPELEKTFYRQPNSDNLLYFTGIYEQGLAVFENETGEPQHFFSNTVSKLYKLDKREIKELKNLESKSKWLEEKLK